MSPKTRCHHLDSDKDACPIVCAPIPFLRDKIYRVVNDGDCLTVCSQGMGRRRRRRWHVTAWSSGSWLECRLRVINSAVLILCFHRSSSSCCPRNTGILRCPDPPIDLLLSFVPFPRPHPLLPWFCFPFSLLVTFHISVTDRMTIWFRNHYTQTSPSPDSEAAKKLVQQNESWHKVGGGERDSELWWWIPNKSERQIFPVWNESWESSSVSSFADHDSGPNGGKTLSWWSWGRADVRSCRFPLRSPGAKKMLPASPSSSCIINFFSRTH